MPYFVAQYCTGLPCHECVAVCPEDCFYHVPLATHVPGIGFLLAGNEGADTADSMGRQRSHIGQLMIHPDQCTSCGACETECPVEAIFEDINAPEDQLPYISINARITRKMTPE